MGAKFFIALPDLKPAGTLFNYNTSGSFILGVLVEKLTGKSFLEYLRPEFDEIGISRNIWCVKSPDGFSWGGSGVVCTLRDFAKFAELILHRGEYRGKQLIPRSYMEAATSMRISNQYENAFSPTRNCGYGYQIWMTEHGFCLSGMGLQMAYCFPDKDMLFVCNGDTQCENDTSNTLIYDLVRFLLYDNTGDEKLLPGKSFELLSARIFPETHYYDRQVGIPAQFPPTYLFPTHRIFFKGINESILQIVILEIVL